MREIPIYNYIYVGTTLRFLQDAEAGRGIHTNGGIIANADQLVKAFEQYSMPVSFRASINLRKFVDELRSRPEKAALTAVEASELSDLADQLRQTVSAEGIGIFAFITSDKRYSTEKLLNNVRALLTPKTFESLPAIAQEDLAESGKCIAFERSTAAAFHALRATEAVLRHLYCCIVVRKRVSPLMWGNVVVHLRKRKRLESNFLDQLDIIRKNFRNPTQHPEKLYDIDEAQNLLSLCVHAIDLMAAHPSYTPPKI